MPYEFASARGPEKDSGGTTLLQGKAEAAMRSSLSRGRSVGAKALVAWTTLRVRYRVEPARVSRPSRQRVRCPPSTSRTHDSSSRRVDRPDTLLAVGQSDTLDSSVCLQVEAAPERLADEMGNELPGVERRGLPGED